MYIVFMHAFLDLIYTARIFVFFKANGDGFIVNFGF